MLRRFFALLSVCIAFSAAAREGGRSPGMVAVADLPTEAAQTLLLIDRDGPYPYRRDGVVFKNLEKRLPIKARGYYREYTVPTPGSPDRGARRIVTGAQPPAVFYYSDDHYRSFRRIVR